MNEYSLYKSRTKRARIHHSTHASNSGLKRPRTMPRKKCGAPPASPASPPQPPSFAEPSIQNSGESQGYPYWIAPPFSHIDYESPASQYPESPLQSPYSRPEEMQSFPYAEMTSQVGSAPSAPGYHYQPLQPSRSDEGDVSLGDCRWPLLDDTNLDEAVDAIFWFGITRFMTFFHSLMERGDPEIDPSTLPWQSSPYDEIRIQAIGDSVVYARQLAVRNLDPVYDRACELPGFEQALFHQITKHVLLHLRQMGKDGREESSEEAYHRFHGQEAIRRQIFEQELFIADFDLLRRIPPFLGRYPSQLKANQEAYDDQLWVSTTTLTNNTPEFFDGVSMPDDEQAREMLEDAGQHCPRK